MTIGEWDQRQLCPDGGCVGVIGPDGTCKACGRVAPNWGDERTRGLIDLPDDEDAEHEAEHAAEAEDEDEAEAGDQDHMASGDATAASSPSDWDARTLCPDDSCIGVIGPDGHCGVCGKVAP